MPKGVLPAHPQNPSGTAIYLLNFEDGRDQKQRKASCAAEVPLIMNGLEIPSLRYVLESMIMRYSLGRGDYRSFFNALAALAQHSGKQLSLGVEKHLKA